MSFGYGFGYLSHPSARYRRFCERYIRTGDEGSRIQHYHSLSTQLTYQNLKHFNASTTSCTTKTKTTQTPFTQTTYSPHYDVLYIYPPHFYLIDAGVPASHTLPHSLGLPVVQESAVGILEGGPFGGCLDVGLDIRGGAGAFFGARLSFILSVKPGILQ